MVDLTEIERFLHEFLAVGSFSDAAVNGIQVRGREKVRCLVTGVSACMQLFEAAVAKEADLILVHHGLFWEKSSRVIDGNLKKRLYHLLRHDLTLMAFHLPLDSHPQVGNNAQILAGLQLIQGEPFGRYRGKTLSYLGTLPEPLPFTLFRQRVEKLFGPEILLFPFGPEMIQRVAVCSGAAPELVEEAKMAGADLFLSGEPGEPLYHFALEESIHCIAAGHYRTESLGVQALGSVLAQRFGLEHHFVEVPNPV